MDGLLLLLPVLGAPALHAPVLRWDLLPALRRPLDGGATIGGHRVFGDNKTWRGALCMTGGVVLATCLLRAWPWWWDAIPDSATSAGPVVLGLLIGLGVVAGELPNSFLKRRLGIAPGTQRRTPAGLALTLLDQGDLVLGIWVFLAPLYVMPLTELAVAFLVVSAIHLALNVVGYAVGARTAPL